jgi:two-component system response regulator CpxR
LKKILIVDDDPSTRFVVRLILEREGYVVVEAGNGQAALDLIKTDPLPDVVMTDLMMPVMTGTELIRRLRSDPRTVAIRIAVVSSNADAASSLRSSGQVDEIFGKPFTAGKLVDGIRAILSNSTSGRQSTGGRS